VCYTDVVCCVDQEVTEVAAREKDYHGRTLVRGDAKVNDRVAYEDMANPYQEGTVAEVVTSEWGTQYRVRFDAVESKFGPEYGLAERETVSDLRQYGWTLVEEAS
jgi:hypothetical protein